MRKNLILTGIVLFLCTNAIIYIFKGASSYSHDKSFLNVEYSDNKTINYANHLYSKVINGDQNLNINNSQKKIIDIDKRKDNIIKFRRKDNTKKNHDSFIDIFSEIQLSTINFSTTKTISINNRGSSKKEFDNNSVYGSILHPSSTSFLFSKQKNNITASLLTTNINTSNSLFNKPLQRDIGSGDDDPIGGGGGTDDPNQYNDSPIQFNPFILIFLLFIYVAFIFFRNSCLKFKKKFKTNRINLLQLKFSNQIKNCNMKKGIILTIAAMVTLLGNVVQAQVTVGSNVPPAEFSLLQVDAANKKGGVRLPQLTTTQRDALSVSGNTAAPGLTIYNSTTGTIQFWNGVSWVDLTTGSSSGWLITGNSGTVAGTNFIGTKDDVDIVFKRNAIEAGRLSSGSINNVSFGLYTLNSSPTGTMNTAVGNYSLEYLTAGILNTAIGYQSLMANTTGSYNTAIGGAALPVNTTGYSNVAVGTGALNANTSGYENSAIGMNSMYLNKTGYDNVAVGTSALYRNTRGNNKVAIGVMALSSDTLLLSFNTAVGAQALRNATGANNTATGYLSLTTNTSGTSNTATGNQALASNSTGCHNTAMGNVALQQNTTSSFSSAFGAGALQFSTGNDNTGVGFNAMFATTTGTGNTAVGSIAMAANTTGKFNAGFGQNSGANLTTGSYNTAIGCSAGNMTTGNRNLTIGFQAGVPSPTADNQMSIANCIFGTWLTGTSASAPAGNIGINTSAPGNTLEVKSAASGTSGVRLTNLTGAAVLATNASGDIIASSFPSSNWALAGNAGTTAGTNFIGTTDNADLVFKVNSVTSGRLNTSALNTSFGYNALPGNTGSNNTATGYSALTTNTTGVSNTATGNQALTSNTTGSHNTAVGNVALQQNTTSSFNSAFGAGALQFSTGSQNTGIGMNALTATTTGCGNTAVGTYSMTANTTGWWNSSFGQNSGSSITTGGYNTAIGCSSGNMTTGSQNITIGFQAGVPSPTADNQMSIANCIFGTGLTGTSASAPAGNIGINTSAPGNTLEVKSTASGTSGVRLTNLTGAAVLATNASGDIIATSFPSWTLTGNAGTTAGTNFIGTTDDTDLVFKINATQSGRLNRPLSNTSFGFNSFTNNTTGSSNAALGSYSLNANTTGVCNTAVGSAALIVNTVGNYNTAIGQVALNANTTGSGNVAIGQASLFSSVSASNNVAVGTVAMRNNTTGSNNTATGYSSLTTNTTGTSNTAIGNQALALNTTGNHNTAVGNVALQQNTTSSSSSAFGAGALQFSTADQNTGIGMNAMYATTTGWGNTAVGTIAMAANTTGSVNSSFGQNSGSAITTGSYNTAIGCSAGNMTTGNRNLTIGYLAGVPSPTADNQMSIANCIFGTGLSGSVSAPAGYIGINTAAPGNTLEVKSGAAGTSGVRLTNLPSKVLATNASGDIIATSAAQAAGKWSIAGNSGTTAGTNFIGTTDNTDLVFKVNSTPSGRINNSANNTNFGYYSNPNNNGTYDTALGAMALQNVNTASTQNQNTGIGVGALSATTQQNETGVGFHAGYSTTGGYWSTYIGSDAAENETLGYNSVIVGKSAFCNGTSSSTLYSGLLAIGGSAFLSTTTYNAEGITGIGYSVNSNTTVIDGGNQTIIGTNISFSGSIINFVQLGNTSTSSIGGQVDWTNRSDKRIKENIREDVPGLAFIEKLKPISYTFNLGKQDAITGNKAGKDPSSIESRKLAGAKIHTGFAAQDVEEVLDSLGYDFDGLVKPQNGKDLYSLSYGLFTVPLVKAVQEQQATLHNQENEIDLQQQQIESQQHELDMLNATKTKYKQSLL